MNQNRIRITKMIETFNSSIVKVPALGWLKDIVGIAFWISFKLILKGLLSSWILSKI